MVLGHGRRSRTLLDGGKPGCIEMLTEKIAGVRENETGRPVRVMTMSCLAEEREKMDWPPDNPSNVVGLCQTLWIEA